MYAVTSTNGHNQVDRMTHNRANGSEKMHCMDSPSALYDSEGDIVSAISV